MRIKIFRLLVCLVVICAMVVNVSPIRAEASAGALLGSIAGVTSVNVPAGLVYGAAAIALGVMAGSNDDFVNMVDYAVDTATDWVKDGTVELLRVVDATGKAAYYAANDLLEDMRSWLIASEVVEKAPSITVESGTSYFLQTNPDGRGNDITSDVPFYVVNLIGQIGTLYGDCRTLLVSTQPAKYNISGWLYEGGSIKGSKWLSGTDLYYYELVTGTTDWYLNPLIPCVTGTSYQALASYVPNQLVTNYDLNLGNFSSVPVDGSSALDWSEEYASKRIYVTGGSNDPDPPDENNGKWFWPIALPLTAATLLAMSQADEWSGETPQEFDDYTQNTEFEILDRPEFGEYQSIVIQPVTSPSPDPGGDPDIGGNPDPTAPGEPSPDPDPEPDPEPVPDPSTDPDVDPDFNPDAGGNGSQNPEPPGVSDYTLDLTDFFPFCIPFDIYDLVQVLDAEPEAPHFLFDVDFPYMEEPWHIDIDFSTWDPVALVLRRLELLLFIVGLAMATRNYYIRG